MLRRQLGQVGNILIAVVVVALIIGQLLGQPVLLAYVTSDSMAPTMNEGDGFIAIPSAVAPSPEAGDVVTFQAQELEGGGLTTHRIVREADEGYITKGDGNPFADQANVEPPVTSDQIVATALQVGGTTVTIPYLGTAVTGVRTVLFQGLSLLAGLAGIRLSPSSNIAPIVLFAAGLGLLVVSTIRGAAGGQSRETRRTTKRDELDMRVVALALVLLVLIPANLSMLSLGGPTELTIDGEEIASSGDVSPGEPVSAELTVRNGGLVTMLYRVSSPDVTVKTPSVAVPPGQQATIAISVIAPPPDEQRTVELRQNRYFVLLPESVLRVLSDMHVLAPVAVLNVFIGGAILTLVSGFLGFDSQQIRETGRNTSWYIDLKRTLFR